MTGWRDGLGPWTPVVEGDRLYGRGGADDGYAAFASLLAIEAAQADGHRPRPLLVLIEASEESGSPDLPAHVDGARRPDRLARAGGLPRLRLPRRRAAVGHDVAARAGRRRADRRGAHRGRALRAGERRRAVELPADPPAARPARGQRDRARSCCPSCTSRSPPTAWPSAADTAAALPRSSRRRVPVRRHDAADDRRPDRAAARPDVAPDAQLHRRRRHPADEPGRQRAAPVDDARPQLPPPADVRSRGRPRRHRAHAPRRPAGRAPRCASSTPSRRRAGTRRRSPRGWPPRSTRRRTAAFGQPARTFGEGGTIPFMGMLGEQFPAAQFVVTGVLVPGQQRPRPERVPAPADGPPGHRVHRPPARRPRRLAVALTALVAASPACADDEPAADVVAVEVAAQPCDRPHARPRRRRARRARPRRDRRPHRRRAATPS